MEHFSHSRYNPFATASSLAMQNTVDSWKRRPVISGEGYISPIVISIERLQNTIDSWKSKDVQAIKSSSLIQELQTVLNNWKYKHCVGTNFFASDNTTISEFLLVLELQNLLNSSKVNFKSNPESKRVPVRLRKHK